MDIQVWSDVVCPWCYIGKRRLEKALASFDGEVSVTYRAYQLDPAPVTYPVPTAVRFAERGQMFTHVAAIGASEGLRLDFERALSANTFDAHRLLFWAFGRRRQADMLEALQRAHFTEGIDLGSRPALAAVAESIGLDPATAFAYLESTAGIDVVNADLAEARVLGVTSVPTFIIDRKFVVQGAQEPATLLTALTEIARRSSLVDDVSRGT